MLGKGFDSKDKREKKMDLNVLVWDDCIRPIRALVFVLVQQEARMQADNEMSGAGGWQAVRVGVHLPSSSLSSVSGQSLPLDPSRSRIIFISTERGRKEGAMIERRETPLCQVSPFILSKR